ncbi:metal ABC transporter ATP-binding protein [Acidocella sp.]|uniref:metal ABC transporter ATP-binding protein n=1 Tax=Acidocella sp. TaxID=50710 RepID=UPI0026291948|nr:metal ABC transporter ATP-binding protein [Acidocella sp.]
MSESGAALSVSGLAAAPGGRPVLRGLDFTLPRGGFCGLIGANGAGKTTLLRALLGLIPAQGRVEASGRLGYVPQKLEFDPDLPLRARDFVGLGLDGQRFGLPWPGRGRREAIARALEAVEAESFAAQRLGRLSGGQQQRVMIAHALVRRPAILLLDEPLASLDLKAAAGIVSLLKRLCREEGVSVLLAAHDMNPLLPAMDRILYLAGGRAVCGGVDEVVCSQVLSRLYGHHIDVLRVHGRILVVAGEGGADQADEHVTVIP